MREEAVKGRKEYHFDSLSDFINWLDKNKRPNGKSVTGGRECFSGNLTWSEAMKLARDGWHEGAQKLHAATEKIKSIEQPLKDEYQWDVTGDLFDVGTMLTGQPEHWLQPQPNETRQVYQVLVNIGASSAVDVAQLENKGAATLALIDKLQENPNNIVELKIVSAVKDCIGVNIEFCIDLGCTPLDIPTVAFVVAHPAFFRKLIFCAREIVTGSDLPGRYGYTRETYQDISGEGSIYIQSCGNKNLKWAEENFKSEKTALEWINRTIESMAEQRAA